MKKINAQRASFFKGHPGCNEFWFTSDNQARFNIDPAVTHGRGLGKLGKSDVVEHVTRAEAEQWMADNYPKIAGETADALDVATSELKAAQDAFDKLPQNTAASKKVPYGIAVSTAQKKVDAAAKAHDIALADAAPYVNVAVAAEPVVNEPVVSAGDQIAINSDDSDEVKTAKQAYNDAITAKLAVPADAATTQKTQATKAVNAAKKALDALVPTV
jgi:hypothetical protein